jgi:dienelactone hydrolase
MKPIPKHCRASAIQKASLVAAVVVAFLAPTCPGQTPGNHRFNAISVLPDRSLFLSLTGSVANTFLPYFDIYVLERSTNLSDWAPLPNLLRTNASATPLTWIDTGAANFSAQFYRTPTNHLFTALAQPTGQYAVGRTTRTVTDLSRTNRYNIPTNAAFMLTIWYPAQASAGSLPATYIDRPLAGPLAESHVGSSGDNSNRLAQFHAFSIADAPLLRAEEPFPVIIYSHGYTFHRQDNSEKLEELASHGFVAVAMDHIDCRTTVYPDGTVARGIFTDNPSEADLNASVTGRLADDRFVLEELARLNASDPLLAGALDLSRLGAMGWSLGNSDLGEAARTDDRFKAVAMLEGYLQGADTLRQVGLGRPLLALYAQYISELSLFNKATRDAWLCQIRGTDHFVFKDVTESTLATDAARRGAETIRACVLSFFNKYLRNQDDHLLDDLPMVYTNVFNFMTKALRIATQPQSRNVVRGGNVTFSVLATSAQPIAYQWRFNGTDLPTATNSTFTLTNVQPTDAGSYTVVVADGITTLTSQAATLTVGERPAITVQPESQTVHVGDTVSLSVSAAGTLPLSYRWRRGVATVTNMILGETTAVLTLTNVQTNQAGNYTVLITNLFGVAPPSSTAVLTVLSP